MQLLKFATLVAAVTPVIAFGQAPVEGRDKVRKAVMAAQSLVTSVVYTSSLVTVVSCDATVSNCPRDSTTIITSVIPISTTSCPLSELTSVPSEVSPASASTSSQPPAPPAPIPSTTSYKTLRVTSTVYPTLTKTLTNQPMSSAPTLPSIGSSVEVSSSSGNITLTKTVETVPVVSSPAPSPSAELPPIESPIVPLTVPLTNPFRPSSVIPLSGVSGPPPFSSPEAPSAPALPASVQSLITISMPSVPGLPTPSASESSSTLGDAVTASHPSSFGPVPSSQPEDTTTLLASSTIALTLTTSTLEGPAPSSSEDTSSTVLSPFNNTANATLSPSANSTAYNGTIPRPTPSPFTGSAAANNIGLTVLCVIPVFAALFL